MTTQAVALLVVFLAIILACTKPLGLYIAWLMDRSSNRLETGLYRLCGIQAEAEMNWKQYALGVLVFNTLGTLFFYGIQRLQAFLPLNPQQLSNVSPDSAFNTAISFVSNTSWQGYAGESTMAYLTQMLGLTVQSFLSAATGIAVALVLIRGFVRRSSTTIGNFWIDLTRSTLYILLPLCLVIAIVLLGQGVIQNFAPYQEAATLATTTYEQPVLGSDGQPLQNGQEQPIIEQKMLQTQTLPMGPVASQEAIKVLSSDGGGFFNANSAHPYENPTALANFLQMLAIFLIPAALTYTFGYRVGDTRQGWAVFAAMAFIFVVAAVATTVFEQQGNPLLSPLGVDLHASNLQAGGNMEGKETRFGIAASALFATVTTAASPGAVNAMHDSFTPLGGFVPMWLIQTGEVVFGGVGSGLYGMLLFAILAVFIAGLMIGRTPEYLGKKIEAYDIKMTSLAILITPLLVLVGTAVAVATAAGKASIFNPGPHGFSEVLYALSSAANNNGSAFAGLSANTPFYNILLAIAMWFSRFTVIVPVLAIAGSLALKKHHPVTTGTMPTHGLLFVALLVGTVLTVGALTYIPGLALGPVAEHLMLWSAH